MPIVPLDKIRKIIRRPSLRRAYLDFVRAGNRLVKISFPDRIGHLSQEIDGLLRDWTREGRDTKKLFLQDIGAGFANSHLVSYYRPYLNIVPDCAAFEYIRNYGDPEGALVETHPYEVAMYQTAKIYESFALWGDRPPLFELTPDDIAAARAALAAFGVPQDGWFVCLHAREGGYSTIDEHIHSFRSVDIDTFLPAIDEIVARGGRVIRMGDSTMRPFGRHEGVIDYAQAASKSPQLDIALTAMCRFFLGTASGMFNVAEMFGRPCVVTNMAPISAGLAPGLADISIFQRLRTKDGRVLDVKDALDAECGNYRLAEEFATAGLENIKNSTEEILEAVMEMLERMDGVARYASDDLKRQALFKSWLRQGHYAYGAGSNVGREFLRRHIDLARFAPIASASVVVQGNGGN